ncbi:MAG: efflux RND transporter periplasmic adaptor subunit [Paracoccaceae bacterium]|nr:efflux RND transporter periplasmic adaptor subunit [Paracoccaceae bacterium]
MKNVHLGSGLGPIASVLAPALIPVIQSPAKSSSLEAVLSRQARDMIRRLLQIAVLVAAGAAAWWFASRPITVTIATISRGDAARIVYATGVVEPKLWSEVTPLRRGRIIETCRCEGTDVASGALLFRLDDAEVSARLTELEARLGFAEQEFIRAEDLLDRRVGTREKYEEAFANVSGLRASVASVRSQLADLEIRAPMAGQVLRIDGEVGEVAEPGTALAWVGQPQPLRVVAEVNEEDIPVVHIGQRALLAADAFPGENLPAEVAAITPKGDPVLKTYRVYLALPADTPLFIGMSIDVNIVIAVHEDVMLAPAESVTGGRLQIVDAEGVVELRPVTLGIVGAERVEILDSAAAGEQVVSPAVDGLVSGDRVRVR